MLSVHASPCTNRGVSVLYRKSDYVISSGGSHYHVLFRPFASVKVQGTGQKDKNLKLNFNSYFYDRFVH